MSNMSYVRFENTYRDLVDCHENLAEPDLSESEAQYRRRLIKVCAEIVRDAVDEGLIEAEEIQA